MTLRLLALLLLASPATAQGAAQAPAQGAAQPPAQPPAQALAQAFAQAFAQAPAPGGSAPAGPAPPSAPDAWVPRGTAEIIMLDKLRAQPTTLSIKVGDSARFGTLAIAVKGCAARPPDLPQNAAVFLDITDSRGSAPVFHGWVLSNTPAVSQFEHPVYDLRLAACR